MLVLTRRTGEKVVFPGIAATVQVVASRPGVVRLGIDAPPEVAVHREEVLRRAGAPPAADLLAGKAAEEALHRLNHAMRNRLNTATVGLALLKRQRQMGLLAEMDQTLARVDREIEALRQQVEENAAAPPAPRRPPRRALLVEDDANECELLAGFLRLAGIEVATAGDGADALDYLRGQGCPDVVLLDMQLPRCDGASTVRAIRSDPSCRGLKIFAVSGHPPERFAVPPEAGGVNGWFRKPINPEQLLCELSRELEPPA
jgi:carbon storage regulator CsrA